MDFFVLASWALALVLVVTVYWPLNVPVMALAYKVRHGTGPLPHETGPFWLRSAAAALGLTVLSGLVLLVNGVLVDRMALPAGPVHLFLLMTFLPAATFYLFWMFAFEDFFEAFSLLLVYLLLPGLPLLLLDRFTRLWQPVKAALAWLQPSSLL